MIDLQLAAASLLVLVVALVLLLVAVLVLWRASHIWQEANHLDQVANEKLAQAETLKAETLRELDEVGGGR